MSNTPTSLTILKVRRTRKHVVIHYRNGEEDHQTRSRDNPLPAFDAAVSALVPLVCTLLHLPQEYAMNMKATGLTISDGSGNEMVTIVAQKSLDDANGPFNIATPLRLMDLPTEEGAYSPPLSEAQAGLVDEVIEQAKAYNLGNRAQGQIPLENGEDEESDDPDADKPAALAEDRLIEMPPQSEKKARKRKEAAN